MNFLAASSELGTHPATALLLGGIVAACLRGRFASLALILAPIIGLWYVHTMEVGSSSTLSLFGYEIQSVMADRQAKLFGYLFHIAALVAGIYSFHLRDPWQVSMALLYAASAVGVAFAGDMLSLFLWWEGFAITSVFQIWGRRTKEAEEAGFRYLFFHVSSGLLLLAGIIFRYHGEGADALSLAPLTEALEAGDLGALLILLAVGIKAAFPGLHVWLKDGYAEATPTGPVWLCAFTTKCAVCMLARLFPGAEVLITIGGVMAMFPIFYAVIENDLRRVLCYSKINQIGFMVVGIGIGTDLAIDGAIAHAFTHVLYKGLLFMSMGAVLFRTGEIRGSHLGGTVQDHAVDHRILHRGSRFDFRVPALQRFRQQIDHHYGSRQEWARVGLVVPALRIRWGLSQGRNQNSLLCLFRSRFRQAAQGGSGQYVDCHGDCLLPVCLFGMQPPMVVRSSSQWSQRIPPLRCDARDHAIRNPALFRSRFHAF